MFRMVGMLFMVLVFGCSTLGVSEPLPIYPAFPYPCDGRYKNQELSDEVVTKILEEHKNWLTDPKDPKGRQANFCGAQLSNHNFQGADLTSATFQMAMLTGANFTGAHFNDAKLQGANLSGANFSHAHLKGAELDHAMLHLAKFQNTFLSQASLLHTMLYKAQFHGVDLTEVKGLVQSQINMACLDGNTKLPKDLTRPKPCREKTQN